MRKKRDVEARRVALPTQRDVLRDVMLASSKFGLWLTLKELGLLTGYGEASISAQLRHLRKRRYGGFVLAKRCREEGKNGRGAERGSVWEYLLSRKARRNMGERKVARRGGLASALETDGGPADHCLVAARSAKRRQDRRTPHASVRRGAR